MSEEQKEEFPMLDNISELDAARIKRLKVKGHYITLIDEYEQLRIRFSYEPSSLDQKDAIRFVTLCKFFMENGHTESFKLHCKYIYQRYMGKFGL